MTRRSKHRMSCVLRAVESTRVPERTGAWHAAMTNPTTHGPWTLRGPWCVGYEAAGSAMLCLVLLCALYGKECCFPGLAVTPYYTYCGAPLAKSPCQPG